MIVKLFRPFFCIAILVAMGLEANNVLAQSFPMKPVRFVCDTTAGSPQDLLARVFGRAMAKEWNQPVIVENRPGGGGVIGANLVAKAAPDGYTLFFTTSNLAVNASLRKKLPFDPLTSFAPISQLTSNYLVLTINSKLRAKSFHELIALAKSEPGKLNAGHPGFGTMPQLAMALVTKAAGLDVVGIPYRGMAQISKALVSDQVNMAFMPLTGRLEAYMKAGKLRALAVTGNERSPLLPKVPTLVEEGLPKLSSWYGLFAPAGTPHDILELIQKAAVKAMHAPNFKNPLLGVVLVGSTVDKFKVQYKADIAAFSKIVKEAGIPSPGE